jgi:hypothetical protein
MAAKTEYRGWEIEPYTLLGWRGVIAKKGAQKRLFRDEAEARAWIDQVEGFEYHGWTIRKVEGFGTLTTWMAWIAERGEDRYGFPTLEEAKRWVDKGWPVEAEKRRVRMMEKAALEDMVRRGVYERVYDATVISAGDLRAMLQEAPPRTLFLVLHPFPATVPSFYKGEEAGRVYYGWEERARRTGSTHYAYLQTDNEELYRRWMKSPNAVSDPLGAEAAGKRFCVWILKEFAYTEPKTHETPNVYYAARRIYDALGGGRILVRVLVQPPRPPYPPAAPPTAPPPSPVEEMVRRWMIR